ncbi:hypothetical protein D9758_007896 [Tetrapyrgos nigripes]|uniref:RanBP2-type domain-containing protein n=1 Tax=Tetrapyrgos nigripes TaxID=182062 RepID=A0A8H5D649_9AGAR|nr:hypothetical protein D9758_007896 [Tetrapyrgos nigripes]
MSPLHSFLATQSRVLLIRDLPPSPQEVLSAFFQSSPVLPQSLWARDDLHLLDVWAVFETHEQACALLGQGLSAPISVLPAVESDLEPFNKLVPLHLPSTSSPSRPRPVMLQRRFPSTPADFNLPEDPGNYSISSNPPNPRSNFRLGDWICSSPNCGAHNFGRNTSCIGCGCSRSTKSSMAPSSRPSPSPRFSQASFSVSSPKAQAASYPSSPLSPYFATQVEAASSAAATAPLLYSSKSGHPLLTPSGRAFAVGGRVQNVSSDPLSPCIMYWPDNEPFPEQGQIRPSGLVGVPHPPILNTGNRGPIAHQPGDWICQKCNYLNWRRRKVCQTCLPYAEGNGDSISAAVQAERIALLTSVLVQTQLSSAPSTQPSQAIRSQVLRSQSVTPPQVRRAFVDISPPQSRGPVVHRSQSQVELGAQYNQIQNSRPIYQTSGRRDQKEREPSPVSVYSTPSPLPVQQQQKPFSFIPPQVESQMQSQSRIPVHAPAPLLPSFLQDIVQSPTLSPSSTSSGLSLEDYDDFSSPSQISTSTSSRSRQTSGDSSNLKIENIWRMDGEESKTFTNGFRGLSRTDLVGSSNSRKSSMEKLGC